MPYDKNNNQTKPLLPRVANNTKSPLTPRLATQHIKAVASPITPVTNTPSHVHNNVTPRSSSRKSRLEGGNSSTQTSTHTMNKIETSFFSKPLVRSPSSSPGTMSTPTIFYANDAKSPSASSTQKKQTSFFYANGEKESENRTSRATSNIGPVITPQLNSNYDETLDTWPVSSKANSTIESVVSNFPMRPPSPQKSSIHLTYRKGASQIMSPQNRPHTVPILPSSSVNRSPSPTRPENTIATQIQQSPPRHSRTTSAGSIDSSLISHRASPNLAYAQGDSISKSLGIVLPPHPPANTIFEAPQSVPHSPAAISSSTNIIPTFAEAAANARRERKVMDLEISNSSLLAINKQLEREVRRQKTELRRFRRLSRAGRLSNVTDQALVEENDDTELKEDAPSDDLSDLEIEEDIESSNSDESTDSSTLSNASLSNQSSARLEKDEKRLQLDLSKHRQLLIDSQRINLSLKRCMTLSEDMISEARRALEYTVKVSDIKLGGRVLHHDTTELSETGEESDREHQPTHGRALLGAWSPPAGTTPSVTVTSTDGILGLELMTDNKASNLESGLPYDSTASIQLNTLHYSNEF